MRPLVLIALWLVGVPALAHPLAPALLELRAVDGGHEVLWRRYAVQARASTMTPRLPCEAASAIEIAAADNGAISSRWRIDCADLAGRRIAVDGLADAGINVILRIHRADGGLQQTLLDAGNSAYRVPAQASAGLIFPRYLGLGIGHLLRGADHLLFLLGLIFLLRPARRMVVAVSAFTVGHSLTLAAAVLGRVRFDPGLMELAIAASLLLLGREMLAARPGPVQRAPALAAGGFGLVHGLGFAGALAGVGLPPGDIGLALLAFNLGIELAQLAIIAALAVAVWALRRIPAGLVPSAPRTAPAYLIGVMAAYWCLERGLSVLGA